MKYILIVIIILIISCTDEISSPTGTIDHNNLSLNELQNLIIGKWEWEYSLIMSRNIQPPDNRITQTTEGIIKHRLFNRNSEVFYFENNKLVNQSSYQINKFKMLPADQTEITMISFDQFGSWQLKFIHSDTVMIGKGWEDGTDHYFSRSQ